MGQACFIELNKAFDSSDQSHLFRKLYHCGLRGPTFDITNDSLTDKCLYIFHRKNFTERLLVITAVP